MSGGPGADYVSLRRLIRKFLAYTTELGQPPHFDLWGPWLETQGLDEHRVMHMLADPDEVGLDRRDFSFLSDDRDEIAEELAEVLVALMAEEWESYNDLLHP